MDSIIQAELSALVFALVTLTPWVVEASKQVFHPMKVWSALQVILVLPAAFLVAHNPDYLHPDVAAACVDGVPSALANALVVYALLNACVYVTYYITIGTARNRVTVFQRPPTIEIHDSRIVIFLLLSVGTLGFVIKLAAVGGLSFLLENTTQRVELQSGLGPLNILVDVTLFVSVTLCIRRFALRHSFADLAFLFIILLMVAVMSSVFGGRKATLQMIVMSLILYSAYRPDAMHFSFRILVALSLLYILAISYFFVVLVYRNTSDFAQFGEILPQVTDMVLASFSELLLSLSYLDVYVFSVAHFDPSNFYYGSTFNDLQTAFLPSSLFPDKPAVDDGFYIRYATLGSRLEPGTPAYLLVGYGSWPPETLGAGYMNGGVLLVVVFGLLLGTILGVGFRLASRRPNSIWWSIILCNLFLSFEISNLRITTLLMTAVAGGLVVGLVKVSEFFLAPAVTKPQPLASRLQLP